jgi:hypothetical protein
VGLYPKNGLKLKNVTMRTVRIILFLLAILVGVAAGLYYAWVINPGTPAAVTLPNLRPDYRTDYVLMVAESYQADNNLSLATGRLSALGPDSPARLAEQAILAARDLNYSVQDVQTLAKLAQALISQPAVQGSPTP